MCKTGGKNIQNSKSTKHHPTSIQKRNFPYYGETIPKNSKNTHMSMRRDE